MRTVYIIGITGGTGAGKMSAVRGLQKLGALALDCDEIYHELLSSNVDMKAEIEARFEGVSTDGEIDRKKLSEVVFSDPHALNELNSITHKYINAEVDCRIESWEAQGGKHAALEAIALIESGQNKKCAVVIGVIAPAEIRTARIMKRDGLTREQALGRINAQKPNSYYEENCDFILENTYESSVEFEEKCTEYFTRLLGGK